MAGELGRRLYDAGWHQGCLLGPLTHLVHFRIEDPYRIPKNVVQDAKEQFEKAKERGDTRPGVGQAVRRLKQKDLWVLATQDCDLVKSVSAEPYVVAVRAFKTSNDKILQVADGNSASFFLLDPDQGLVADATVQVQLEKPVLLEFEPKEGIATEERRKRFARGLARRAHRPAFPDSIVEIFVAPFLEGLKRLAEETPSTLVCLGEVQEVRIRVSGESPTAIDLLFFTERGGPLDGGVGLADLVAHIERWLDPKEVALRWMPVSLGEISVEDYVATEQVNLDHYTYRGETKVGLGPPEGI